jgi:hypothetical protein
MSWQIVMQLFGQSLMQKSMQKKCADAETVADDKLRAEPRAVFLADGCAEKNGTDAETVQQLLLCFASGEL